MPPTRIIGNCNQATTGVFTATGTANGASKYEAFQRACAQAQTLLDSQAAANVSCPAACPDASLDQEPDYTAAPPSYVSSPEASGVFICTVTMSRVVTVTCSSNAAGGPAA